MAIHAHRKAYMVFVRRNIADVIAAEPIVPTINPFLHRYAVQKHMLYGSLFSLAGSLYMG